MNLSQMITEVYNLTNRPDLVTLTTSAVKSSTLKMHCTDFFTKDLVETGITFISSAYVQSFDSLVTFPRWRALSYFRTNDTSVSPNVPGLFFEPITPTSILDSYGVDKTNVIYQAGSAVNLKGDTSFSAGIIGYYQYPDTTDATFSSWIAAELPWAIIYDAATKILKSIGYDEQAAGTRIFATEFQQELIAANILMVGS